jgi:hypothetical protein
MIAMDSFDIHRSTAHFKDLIRGALSLIFAKNWDNSIESEECFALTIFYLGLKF